MIKQLFLYLLTLILLACNNNKSKNSSKPNSLDSLSIIYTKDKWSIFRPNWENLKHFAVTGKIMNTSTVFGYKDFVVEVCYKSENGTLLATKTYTLNASIRPQAVIDFDEDIKDTAPEGTSFYQSTWKLISTTQYIYSE